jgi:prepilin-type N-terminal cleavage/methylation domain-containing protein
MKKILLKNKIKGFSLIEVAIAIVIIGLVASFTLKGKELIHTAKLNSIAEQVNSFKIAIQMFVDKYGSMPGDFSNAKDMIDPGLENGSGNGSIKYVNDAKKFWKHLVASGSLSIELINGYPVSKLGGYYSVSSEIPGHEGTWLILSNGTTNNSNFKGILSQEDAYHIDKKNDTGNPSTGEIRTLKAQNMTPIGQKYDIKNKNKDCIIMFKIW